MCVFCGSHPGRDPGYLEAARRVGEALAERGMRLVYGGASNGLMGALARGARARGGTVLGVLPESLAARELAETACTDFRVVPDLPTRKALMFSESDAFLALPGGFGTLDELFEVLVLRQLDTHGKAVGVYDPSGFYEGVFAWVEQATREGFLYPAMVGVLEPLRDPEALGRWLSRVETGP